jgi:hypothetical protein
MKLAIDVVRAVRPENCAGYYRVKPFVNKVNNLRKVKIFFQKQRRDIRPCLKNQTACSISTKS